MPFTKPTRGSVKRCPMAAHSQVMEEKLPPTPGLLTLLSPSCVGCVGVSARCLLFRTRLIDQPDTDAVSPYSIHTWKVGPLLTSLAAKLEADSHAGCCDWQNLAAGCLLWWMKVAGMSRSNRLCVC